MLKSLFVALSVGVVSAFAPEGWKLSSKQPAAHESMQLTFAVKHSDKAAIDSKFWDVSDPESANFAKHVSQEELVEMSKPDAKHFRTVMEWLIANGISRDAIEFSPAGDFVHVKTNVKKAQQLLKTKYSRFESSTVHALNGKTQKHFADRCKAVNLPHDVREALDFVAPTTQFPPRARTLKVSGKAKVTGRHNSNSKKSGKAVRGGDSAALLDATAPMDGVTPDTIRAAYRVGATVAKNKYTKQLAAGFLGQYASLSDLATFFQQVYPAGSGQNLNIVGPNDQTNPGIEASLDVDYILGLGTGVNTTFWYTDGTRPGDNEPFVEFLTAIDAMADRDLPHTISVSYGDNENTVDYAYASRANVEFQKLALRGVSILYSSGDGGVSGGQAGACGPNGQFIPTFPAGSPVVTSVGATQDVSSAASFSSGGFSNYWAPAAAGIPHFQKYLSTAKHLPANNLFNTTGNGFPVVSAFGTNFNIVCGGFESQVDGTSCSAPTFAGIVSLINDARLNVGKSTLGFLNTLFFKNPQIFTDITVGNNPGCGTNGFFCQSGWDPVTGLGTPDFEKFLALALSLP